MKFENKICVITGGALGIGRCLVQEFAKSGCKVAFIDINDKEGNYVLNLLEKDGYDALFYHGDLANEQVLKEFASKVIERYGKIDYLINNACVNKKGLLSECSLDDFNYVLKVGVSAPYFLTLLFKPYFNQDGAIVNISSTRAYMSQADTESYTAAKGGISALTHSLAASLAHKVRVNAINPGWIDTGQYYDSEYSPEYTSEDLLQHFSGKVGKPEDIARLAMFLCHKDSEFINGESITVDGGMSKKMIYHGDEGWKLSPKH